MTRLRTRVFCRPSSRRRRRHKLPYHQLAIHTLVTSVRRTSAMPTRPPHSPFFASLGDVQADSRAPPPRDAPPPAAEGPVFLASADAHNACRNSRHSAHRAFIAFARRPSGCAAVERRFYGVRLRTMRRRQRPRAACSSPSANSDAAVALQELMRLVAMSSTLETRSLDVASRIDDHSHAAPG